MAPALPTDQISLSSGDSVLGGNRSQPEKVRPPFVREPVTKSRAEAELVFAMILSLVVLVQYAALVLVLVHPVMV